MKLIKEVREFGKICCNESLEGNSEYTYTTTYNTWRASQGTANLKAWCRRRTGYVKAQIVLYGYYDPSLVNNS